MKERPIKIVVTGPESSGKTEIARHLAGIFNAEYIPEYARSYISELKRPYTYRDVEHIARVQEDQLKEAVHGDKNIIFLDTYLVITKIWFKEVYGKVPNRIDRILRESEIDLFLLCYYDIEWVEDRVRENPGSRREYLYKRYLEEIEFLGAAHEVIRGIGQGRCENARDAVLKHFSSLKEG